MKLTVVKGNIMKCNERKFCERPEGYLNKTEWQINPDEVVRKAILVRVAEDKYVDVTWVRSKLGLIIRIALGNHLLYYPRCYNDYYVDVTSLKPYYEYPTVDINLSDLKDNIYKNMEQIRSELISENHLQGKSIR